MQTFNLEKKKEERGRLIVMKVISPFILLLFFSFSFSFISSLNFGETTNPSSTINHITIINNDTELFHNNLTGIQGGVADQYYHIRQSWYDDMAIDIFNWLTGDEADTKISNANTTMKSYVDLLNASGLIKNWNATGLIANWSIADLNATGLVKDWNATGLIANWSIDTSNFYLNTNPFGFYNVTTLPASNEVFWNANYSSFLGLFNWNKTYADTLYYSITNPYGFYNSSNFVITDYYLKSNPFGFYNATTLPNLNSTGLIKDWNSTGLIINWSIDASNFYLNSNPYGYYNITTAPIYINDTFGANYSTYLTLFNWNKTYADTLYFGINNWNATNTSYYLATNPFGFYNITTAPIYINDTFGANYSDYLTIKNYALNDTNYNASGLIRDWNATGLIANWSIDTSNFYTKDNPYGFYNITTAPIYINDTFAGNYSTYLTLFNWNKTYADTLYYSISNPYSYYNSTTIPAYYPLNNPYGYYNSTSFDINNYYLKSNPYSFYNSTTLTTNSQLLNGNNYWNSTFSTFNKTYADTLYYGLSNPYGYYNSTSLTTNSQLLNGNNYWNSTFANFNKTYADTLYYSLSNPYSYYNITTAPIYINDTFGANYSDYLTLPTWTIAMNGTLMKSADWNSTNTSYYLASNPFAFYNSTTAPIYVNDTFGANYSVYLTKPTWSEVMNGTVTSGFYNVDNAPIYLNDTFRGSNYTTFLTHIDWAKAINGTLMLSANWNATNTSYALDTKVNSLGNWSADKSSYGTWANVMNGTVTAGLINWAKAINGTLFTTALFNTNYTANDAAYRSITNTSYYLASNPSGFYNSTNAPIYLNDTFRGTNYTNFLTHITWANAVNGTLFKTADYNTNYTTNHPIYTSWVNNYSDYLTTKDNADNFNANYSTFLTHIPWSTAMNNTLAQWSQAMNGTLMSQATFNTNYTANNAIYRSFTANYTNYLRAYNYATNASAFTKENFNTNYTANDAAYRSITNTSYYLVSNPYGYYNSTTLASAETDPKWTANYSTYLTKPTWANVINGTVALQSTVNTNVTTANLHTHKAENITAGTFGTGNYVFDSNVTMDCLLFSTGGQICAV